MLFPTKQVFDEHHFWKTSLHTVSFVSPFGTLAEIVKNTSFQVINGLDVSAHSTNIESSLPKFHKTQKWGVISKKIIARWTDGFFFYDTKSTLHKSALLLRTADCAPVTFAHHDGNIFWIVHIGWKGLVNGIIKNTKRELEKLSQNIQDFDIWIGPMAGEWFEFSKNDFEEHIRPYMENNWLQTDVNEFWEKVSFDLRKLVIAWLKKEWFENITFSSRNTLDLKENLPSWRKGDSERITTIIYN